MSTTLRQAVSNAIAAHSPELAAIYDKTCPVSAVEDDAAQQIHNQNLYWRRELESLDDVDTIELREYLVDECAGGMAEWLRLFHTGILPACLAYALPRSPYHAAA